MTVLIQSQYAPAVLTAMYTNTTAGDVILDKFIARNNDSAMQTLTIYIVPSGGVADNSTKDYVTAIGPGDNDVCGAIVGIDLAVNDSLQVLASTASTIAIRASGRQK